MKDEIMLQYRDAEIHRVTYTIRRRTEGFWYVIDRRTQTSQTAKTLTEELRRLFNSFVPEDHMIPLF